MVGNCFSNLILSTHSVKKFTVEWAWEDLQGDILLLVSLYIIAYSFENDANLDWNLLFEYCNASISSCSYLGGGIGNDGIPEASLEAQTPDVGVFMRFLEFGSDRTLQTAMTIGKFTYIWESVITPHNLRIPNFFGLDPNQVKHFLLGSQPGI